MERKASTTRMCNLCGYETFILNDFIDSAIKCKHCKEGMLEIKLIDEKLKIV